MNDHPLPGWLDGYADAEEAIQRNRSLNVPTVDQVQTARPRFDAWHVDNYRYGWECKLYEHTHGMRHEPAHYVPNKDLKAHGLQRAKPHKIDRHGAFVQ